MKILTMNSRGFDILRRYLPGHEVKCLDEVDENFLNDTEIVLAHNWKKLSNMLPKLKNLRMIQAFTAGTDHFDLSKIPEML